MAVAITLAACGKKNQPVPSENSQPAKISIDTLTTGQSDAPPPAPAASTPEATPQPEPVQGNWWSQKAAGEKAEIMEGWLHQYQTKDPAVKAAILKQIRNSKLSDADKAMLEGLRARFKYPPLPN